MIKKRIHTDLFIRDLTFVDKISQNIIDLTNANNIKLFVRKHGINYWKEQEKTIINNKISFQWNATENTNIGTYDVLLSYDKKSTTSETGKIEYKYDAPSLFQIVNTSEDELNVDSITTVQAVYYGGSDGLSAYQLAVKHGYTGTEVEFAQIESNNADAEVTRQTSEEGRVIAEGERDSAEKARISAETNRSAAETTRKANEESRSAAETTRVTNENTRLGAETIRDTQEGQRVTNENGRVTSEQERASAETNRKNAETNREANEENRKNSEINRETNFEDAIKAVTNSTADANSAAQNANTAASSADTAASNAETAATNANDTESRVAQAEDLRVTAETTRTTSEATRVESENTRVTNEQTRAAAEENRSTAEATRVANEESRQIKEVERDNTEKAIISSWENVMSGLNWYGNEWDMSVQSPDGTRIGNMDLHRQLPIENMMEGVLLDDNGNEVQKLNSLSWIGQDRSGVSGQVMVKIPNFYFRFEFDGNKFRFKMLNQVPAIGKTFPGWNQFFDNSVDYVYCSAYEATLDRSNNKLCSVVNLDPQFRGGNNTSAWDGTYRSLLGRPVSNLSRTSFRNYARARNTANTFWNEYIYTIHVMLSWLFYSEYNTLNSQKDYNAQLDVNGYKQGGLGNGVSDIDWNVWSGYNGNNPFVQCGATDGLGNRSGVVNCNVLAADGSTVYYTAQVPRYRGIENPFGHLWKWSDGINIKEDGTTRTAYVTTHTSKYSDSSYDNYENRGVISHTNGWTTRMLLGVFGDLMPTNVGGSSSTFWCDNYWLNTSPNLYGALLGGGALTGAYAGFGCVNAIYVPSVALTNVGSRLVFVKQA